MKTFRFKTYAVLVLCSLTLGACRKDALLKSEEGVAIGTFYSIKYYTDKDTSYQSGYQKIFERVSNSLSIYDPSSLVSRINRGEEVAVDSMFRTVFRISKEVNLASDNWFDPTIGRLMQAWGIGDDTLNVLTDAQTDSLLRYTGFDKVRIQGDHIRMAVPGMKLDFNAIAKGYTVDLVAAYLKANGVKDFMVEIGGEIRTSGTKPEGKPWSIGIEDPFESNTQRRQISVVELTDKAIATSGNYRKYKVSPEGKKYVHTINPKTGMAIQNDILSASVIMDDCTRADGWATAFMAMGFNNARTLVEKRRDMSVYFVYIDHNEQVQTYSYPEEFRAKE